MPTHSLFLNSFCLSFESCHFLWHCHDDSYFSSHLHSKKRKLPWDVIKQSSRFNLGNFSLGCTSSCLESSHRKFNKLGNICFERKPSFLYPAPSSEISFIKEFNIFKDSCIKICFDCLFPKQRTVTPWLFNNIH